MNLSEHIDSVTSKVQDLIDRMQRLEKENAVLQAANRQIQEQLDLQQQKVQTLKHKLKQTESTLDKTGVEQVAFKQQLDQYIREVDQCIEGLSQA